MNLSTIAIMIAGLATLAFFAGRHRAIQVAGGRCGVSGLHSLPDHYGQYALLWSLLPALAMFAAWTIFDESVIESKVLADLPAQYQGLEAGQRSLLINEIRYEADKLVVSEPGQSPLSDAALSYRELTQHSARARGLLALGAGFIGLAFAWRRIRLRMDARNRVERVLRGLLLVSSTVAILTTLGIFLSVLFESLRFFSSVNVFEFLFGLQWSPQTAIRADQVGSSGAFGAVPLLVGTLLISAIAMLVAVPVGLFSAIYLSEYADHRVRAVAKPMLEVLAGIPTVVYGFFAALTVAPFIRDSGSLIGLDVASESALAAGLVMGIMIIPFVSSLSDDVINAVPQSMRDGSLGLGATRSETVRLVVLPAALHGIVGSILLAVSRAVGETMIVVMAAGLAANLTLNPLESVTTITVQIVTLLVGDQEFDSPKTLAAFALGLMLFVITLLLNILALRVVRRYREQYE